MYLVDSLPRRFLNCASLEHCWVLRLDQDVDRASLEHCCVCRLDRDVDRVALALSWVRRLDRDVDRASLAWSLMRHGGQRIAGENSVKRHSLGVGV